MSNKQTWGKRCCARTNNKQVATAPSERPIRDLRSAVPERWGAEKTKAFCAAAVLCDEWQAEQTAASTTHYPSCLKRPNVLAPATEKTNKKKLLSKQRESTKSPLLGGGGGSSSVSTSSVLIASQSVDRSAESPLTLTRRAVRNSFQPKRLIKAQFYQQSAHQKRPIKRGINMNIMSAAALSLNCTECCMLSALH